MQYHYRHAEQQFGPISLDELIAAARSGSIDRSDLVWAEGWNTWRVAHTVPGLMTVIPPLPAPSMGSDPSMRLLLPVGRSAWAIAAGYLGLFSLLLLPAPLALLAGILAIRDIKKNPEKHGMGRAIFGIVMGALGSALLVLMLVN